MPNYKAIQPKDMTEAQLSSIHPGEPTGLRKYPSGNYGCMACGKTYTFDPSLECKDILLLRYCTKCGLDFYDMNIAIVGT